MYRTAALPVLAGLADVEGISHTAPNTRGALCLAICSAEWPVSGLAAGATQPSSASAVTLQN